MQIQILIEASETPVTHTLLGNVNAGELCIKTSDAGIDAGYKLGRVDPEQVMLLVTNPMNEDNRVWVVYPYSGQLSDMSSRTQVYKLRGEIKIEPRVY